tara:strand:+ start:164 stop:712 length:549 start_codon:yes stop_codon:yes gene_type:complete
MKIKLIISIFVIMFFFKETSASNEHKSIYDIKIDSITGELIHFSDFKNKGILLVNVASYCGFTSQYADLQKLWEKYGKENFVIIGVPSKSFNQEKSTNEEVKKFCEVNFNINFHLTSIYDVKGDNAHDIYKWAKKNFGSKAVPKWNFHKILIDKKGQVVDTFASFTNPMSNKILKKIEEIIN